MIGGLGSTSRPIRLLIDSNFQDGGVRFKPTCLADGGYLDRLCHAVDVQHSQLAAVVPRQEVDQVVAVVNLVKVDVELRDGVVDGAELDHLGQAAAGSLDALQPRQDGGEDPLLVLVDLAVDHF